MVCKKHSRLFQKSRPSFSSNDDRLFPEIPGRPKTRKKESVKTRVCPFPGKNPLLVKDRNVQA